MVEDFHQCGLEVTMPETG